MDFFKKMANFIQDVANDPRIPARDKKVVLFLFALIVSPIDLIPDWIPLFGQIDDIIVLAIILDYFFEVLDQDILLSHYPWGMKSYTWIRRISRFVSQLCPSWVQRRIWKYEGSPYRK